MPWKSATVVVVALIFAAFGCLVWPTPFRYEKVNALGSNQVVIRINRLTGQTTVIAGSEYARKGFRVSKAKATYRATWH